MVEMTRSLSTGIGNLVARLESAESGSRELDAEIYASVHEGWEPGGIFAGNCREIGNPGQFVVCPHYTTSLDAALPGENIVEVRQHLVGPDQGKWTAAHIDGHNDLWWMTAHTEALARRAACLRALASTESGKPHKGSIENWSKVQRGMGLGYYVWGTFLDHPDFGLKTTNTSYVVKHEGAEIETRNSRYTLVGPALDEGEDG